MRTLTSFFAAALICSAAQASDAWSDALSQVRAQVQRKVDSGVPSYAVAIVSRNHPVVFIAAGYADLPKKIKANEHTIYEIGSITKTFTGTMLLQLRDAGKANLDDPLTKHLPDFKMPSPYTGMAAPTLRQMASHTAGLPRMIPLNSLQEPTTATGAEMLASLNTTAAVFPPLTRYKYSNLGVDLMGYALARTAGVPWTDYVDANILKPLGMRESSTVRARVAHGQFATGYVPSGASGAWQPGPPMPFTPLTEASGSIVSSASDMAKYVAWSLSDSDSRVLSPVSRRELHTPLWLIEDWNAGVAVTWFLQKFEGTTLVHHTGGTAGFTSVAAFVPREGVGIVALTNSTDDAHGFARELLKPVLAVAKAEREKRLQDAAAAIKLPPGAEKFAGLYPHGKGMLPPLTVSVVQGELVIDAPMFGHARLMPTQDANVFIATDNEGFDGETIRFDAGKLIIGHGAMVFVKATR